MDFSEKDFQKAVGTPLFRESDPRLVERILREHDCGVKSFESGEVIFSPDLKEKTAGILLCGKAVVNTPDPSKKTLLKAMEALGVGLEETAMLGDQLLTDSYAGRHIGLPSIIVPPINDKKNLFFRFKRLCERPFIRKYAKLHGYREWMSFWRIRKTGDPA